MYGYHYGFYGFDWTYILLIIGMLLSLAASAKLKSGGGGQDLKSGRDHRRTDTRDSGKPHGPL